MIISHRLKYIFIHVPKTGGTSIQFLLENNPEFECDVVGHFYNAKDKDFEEHPLMSKTLDVHAGAKKIKAYFDDNNLDWDSYFKFGFIRNPWDLMVSQYCYFMQSLDNQITTEKNLELIKEFKNKPAKEFIKKITEHDYTNVFLCEAKTHIPMIDYFGRLETINEDMNRIIQMINPNLDVDNFKLTKENTTKRQRDYREYYDEETKNIVREVFKKTIELGDYEF